MKVIDKINGSGLFAQSAFSAATATKDNLGRDITATYLTGVNLPESANWNDTSNLVSSNSAQWSQGKTYEGISPIVVNNYENKISASTWTLTAGNGISFVEDSASNTTRIDCTASGDAGVNSFVTSNSAEILDVNSSYKQNSGTFTTVDWVLGQGYATVGWVLEQGYLTEHQDISNKLDSSAFSSVSGDFLTTAFSIPESATWTDTSNVVQTNSAQWSQGKTYTSPSGTILINGDTLEGTNSAISIVGYEGFVSSYGRRAVGPNDTARYTWDKALPTNIITLDTWATRHTLYWSANTDLTGEIILPEAGRTTQSISIPNATAFAAWSDNFFNIDGATVSAADTLETVVSELAWKNDLPTYSYNSANKLSAINGSALVGDEEVNSIVHSNSATWNDVSTTVQSNSAQWAEGGGSVSSKYGTITVDGSDIEATNSAIEFKSEGFRSSFNDTIADEWNPRTFTWDDYSEGTTFMSRISNYGDDSDVLTYSSNTNVTGNITIPNHQTSSVILQLPNATAVQFTTTGRGIYRLSNIEVTATSSNQVKELAWKNDLPTYSYNSNNKLSAINGSALVGNEDYLVQQGFVQNLTSPYSTIAVKDNKVEATNSAIKSDTLIEGFVSAYNDIRVYPGNSATLTWTNYVPNTKLYVSGGENWQEYTLTYSANTDVTGTITVSTAGQANIEVPTDSTSIVIGNSGYDYYNFTVSAEDYYEVGELAWKSDVPSFEAGPGIKVTQPSAGVVRIGSDETVLYEDNAGHTGNFIATEPFTNFNEISLYVAPGTGPGVGVNKITIPIIGNNTSNLRFGFDTTWAGFKNISFTFNYNNTGMSAFSPISGSWFGWNNNGAAQGDWSTDSMYIYKVVGINRKA